MNTVTISKETLNNFFKRNCLSKRTLEHLLDFHNFYSITGIFCSGTITFRKGFNIHKALINAGYKTTEISSENFAIIPLSKRQHRTEGFKVFVIDKRLIKRNI